MSTLVFAHMLIGLLGIATRVFALAGLFFQKRMDLCNAVFLLTTAAAAATGFGFLPVDGVTSAQLVGFFLIVLLTIAAYARYIRHLQASWFQVYAFTATGALFLNILIATAQSFLHFQALRTLAPTQQSPVYVGVKLTLFLIFIAIAFVVARRAGGS